MKRSPTSRTLDTKKFKFSMTPVRHEESLKRLYRDMNRQDYKDFIKWLWWLVWTVILWLLSRILLISRVASHKLRSLLLTKGPREAGSFIKKHHTAILYVIIAFLLGGLLLGGRVNAATEVGALTPPKHKAFPKLHMENGHPRQKLAKRPPAPVAPVRTAPVAPQRVSVSGSCASWLRQAGVEDTASAMALINRESGCNPNAVNPSSGSCGVAQELPCGKSGCKLGDGACQVKWMDRYVHDVYGSWANALAHSYAYNWY